MRRACFLTLTFVITFALSISQASAAESADPLPSWNAGREKTAILDVVPRVTSPGAGFVPGTQRIAVFDNDGTLWPDFRLFLAAETPGTLPETSLPDEYKSCVSVRRLRHIRLA